MVLRILMRLTLTAAALLISGCHPWSTSPDPSEEKPEPNQMPALTAANGGSGESGRHVPGTPAYVPLIDACLAKGGSRGECIESLPPEALARLAAEEARRGAMRDRQLQSRRTHSEDIVVLGFAAVELPAGWHSRVEQFTGTARAPFVEYFQPGGAGILRMQTLVVPVPVTQAQLRNLTNVDPEIPLAYAAWGDFAGYHFEQIENGMYYRHWWLAKGGGLIVITYQCEPDLGDAERAQVDGIVNSLRER